MSDHGVPSEFQGRIAVIDTQISASLVESLSGKKVPARTVTQSGVYESGFPDQLSHGTVCTALAAENFPKAELLAFRLVWIAAPVWKMCALPFPGVLVKTLMRCL